MIVEENQVYSLMAFFLAVLVAGFLLKGRPLRGRTLDSLEGLARTVKGTIDPGTWFRRPLLRFDASGCPAELTWVRSRSNDELSGGVWLIVSVRLSGVPEGALKIWSRSRPWRLRLGRPWGCPRVVLGDPAIDGEFVIRARPASLAEHLFAPERRAEAASLLTSLVGDEALSIGGGVLRTSFEVGRIGGSGVSDVVAKLRKLTALLQGLPR